MTKKEIKELAKRIREKEMNHKGLVEELKKYLWWYIDDSKRFKNVYFWSPPAHASGRRAYERQNSWDASREDLYNFKFNIDCSCRNIYLTKSCDVLGNRMNVKDCKKLLKELEEEEE